MDTSLSLTSLDAVVCAGMLVGSMVPGLYLGLADWRLQCGLLLAITAALYAWLW